MGLDKNGGCYNHRQFNYLANDTIKKATATSGKAYVKVSKSGKTVTIKGVKVGKAKVTITTKNGGKNVITVTVK